MISIIDRKRVLRITFYRKDEREDIKTEAKLIKLNGSASINGI